MAWPKGAGSAGARPAGWGYSSATLETVAGEVVRVERLPFGKGRDSGVGLTLKTGKEPVRVLLGTVNLLTAGNGPLPGYLGREWQGR